MTHGQGRTKNSARLHHTTQDVAHGKHAPFPESPIWLLWYSFTCFTHFEIFQNENGGSGINNNNNKPLLEGGWSQWRGRDRAQGHGRPSPVRPCWTLPTSRPLPDPPCPASTACGLASTPTPTAPHHAISPARAVDATSCAPRCPPGEAGPMLPVGQRGHFLLFSASPCVKGGPGARAGQPVTSAPSGDRSPPSSLPPPAGGTSP